MERKKVVILLATRNGAEFLKEQLESFRAQTHSNWELVVSDDGSTDDTLAIIEQFSNAVAQRVTVRQGPQLGFWQNFVSLVRAERLDGDLYAYSDQDDVWFARKIENAVGWFATQDDRKPALYFSRTELIAGDGARLGFSPLFSRAPAFRNALVQNIGGGNTMVFNKSALQALRSTPVDVELVSHDWWTYQVITGVGGLAHYDPWPSLLYRQHGQNLVGSNIGLRARLVRLSAFAGGRVVRWNSLNLAMLNRMRQMLTLDNVDAADRFATARNSSLPVRLYQLWKSGVYRQSRIENIGLFVGALFGRL